MVKRIFNYSFAKAQLSAFIGGSLDYIVMIVCTELMHLHYTISIAIGGIIGAAVNFSLNRYWTFSLLDTTSRESVRSQLLKFIPVVLGSIVLKSSGTYLFTSFTKLNYKFSRLIVEFFVSLGFNYLLQKYWVFNYKAGIDKNKEHIH